MSLIQIVPKKPQKELFHACALMDWQNLSMKVQIFPRRIIFSKSSAKGLLETTLGCQLVSSLLFQLALCFSTSKLNLSSMRVLSWKDKTMNLIQALERDEINHKTSL